jgi:RNA polymerase sigma factor (sigma-70 family)
VDLTTTDSLPEDITRCVPPLRRFVRARLFVRNPSRLDHDDIVQETVARALPRLKNLSFRNGASLQGYLHRIATNRVIDHVRQAGRRPAFESLPDDLPDRQASPLDLVLRRERNDRLRRALAQLEHDERRALLMWCHGERDFERLANVLGRPTAGAARVALHRAARKLGRLLAVER